MRARPFKMMSRPVLLAIVGVAGILSIIASGGGGGGGGGSLTSSKVSRYAFVANTSDNSVSTYVVDSTTGRLKWIGKSATGTSPSSVALTPSGKYAYVANSGSGDVTPYSIGTDGGLTVIDCDLGTPATQTCPAGSGPNFIAVDPSGKFAYVANFNGNSISAYTISSTNGLLGKISCSSGCAVDTNFAAGTNPYVIAIDPASKHLYVVNYGSGNVSEYTIASDGSLSAIGTTTAGSGPASIVIDPSGQYAYVANSTDTPTGSVSAYTISSTTGALSSIPCSAGPVVVCVGTNFAAGGGAASTAIDPSGKYLYVGNSGGSDNTVSQFAIGTTGALTSITTAIPAGTAPYAVTVDPSGKFVYAANHNSPSVSQYSIGANGVLTPLNPVSVAGGWGSSGIVVLAGSMAVQAVPKYAYVTNNGTGVNTVSAYTVGSTGGALTRINCVGGASVCSGVDFVAGTSPISVAVDPSGKYAYVANSGTTTVSQYTVGADGSLSPMGTATVTAGTSPYSVAADPSGKYVYVANYGSGNVSQYAIGSSGALTALTSAVAAGTNPASVAVDPSGRFVFVANNGSGSVSAYAINTTTGIAGALTKISCSGTCTGTDFPAGTTPIAVAVDPSGRYLYVANSGNDNVSQYTIGSNGSLTAAGTVSVAPGTTPYSVAVDPSGKYAYVANNGTTDVSQFTIGSGGGLTIMSPSPTAAAAANPSSVAVDPSGRFAYVTNYGATSVSQYSIGATGALTSITGAASAGSNPSSVTTTGTWQ